VQRIEPIGQRRGARLQDDRRLDLVEGAGTNGRNVREARPGALSISSR
jgi:hypothetical protein